jgi:hypothetical protein
VSRYRRVWTCGLPPDELTQLVDALIAVLVWEVKFHGDPLCRSGRYRVAAGRLGLL